MTWFTWRQFRTQTWITVAVLAALGAVLLLTSFSIADAYEDANLAGCGNDCAAAIENFLFDVGRGNVATVYGLAATLALVVPAVIGVFWGAPLIAREVETGTHRLAWNQSVTRTRWLATKLAVVGGAAAATAGLLSWAVTAWASRLDAANADRIQPDVYGARGIVPVGYALFAFMLGVTAGMLIRRTVAAMAATLGVYVAATVAMTIWLRERLVPVSQSAEPFDMSSLEGMMINPDTREMEIVGGDPPGVWLLSNQTITPNGEVFNGPYDPAVCGPDATQQTCNEWVDSLGLRQDLVYHGDNHFWPLQWTETGILVGVAVLLAGFCFWWVRRRLA
jgi:ABC-2 family transporter protein